jgi:hypothetical protein
MRERVTRAALRAFPPAIRSARGDEMLGTLLDASATSQTRFAHEIVDLVRSGLRARATQTAQAGATRIVADGLCLAAVWLLTLFFAADVGNRIRGPLPGDPAALLSSWSLGLLGAALVLALIGSDRLAGAAGLLFTASVFGDPARYDLTGAASLPLLVPLICFGALLLAPRRRKHSVSRLAWLVLPAALAVAAGRADDSIAAVALIGLIFFAPPAFARLHTDPRQAIACVVSAAYFGLRMAQDPGGPGALGLLFLGAAPLILTVVIAHTRDVRQPRVPL